MRLIDRAEFSRLVQMQAPHPRNGCQGNLAGISISRLCGLAKTLIHWTGENRDDGSTQPGIVLRITGSGVWPSSEHLPLLERFLAGLGVAKMEPERVCAIADGSDIADMVSLLMIVLASGWDAVVFSTSGHRELVISHVEFFVARGQDEDACRELANKYPFQSR
jgi:hypothetical protein